MRRITTSPIWVLLLSLALVSGVAGAQGKDAATAARTDRSHSGHGPAFNDGPRQVAWKMEGIGTAHFPVTTAKPEAQAFFDQGINLLHSFWYYEAERAFRHVVWLDPDCAMAYWGLAMTVKGERSRQRDFLKIAREKARKASDRERRYIEALAEYVKEEGEEKARRAAYVKALEGIVLAYPNDLEAKAFLALETVWGGEGTTRLATDALFREILARAPEHPGAHHYRIHLWDGPEAEQALPNCAGYPRAAPAIGHAQHMPGHIYAQLGRWEEAARAMEASARVERRYFREHGMLPFHSWNYAHDLHYLITILGYQGRVAEGIRLARELLAVPRDPRHNTKTGGAQQEGRFALMRMRVRFERWDEILGDGGPDWSDTLADRGWRAYTLGLAHLGKGNPEAARQQLEALDGIRAEAKKAKKEWDATLMEAAGHELGGLLALDEGKLLEGFERLQKAVELERTRFTGDDPGAYPRPIAETLGRAHLQSKNWGLAEAVFRDALKRAPNSGPALAGLVEACQSAGKREQAEAAYAQLQAVWKYADADLPSVRRVRALGLGPRVAARDGAAAELGGARWDSRDLEALGPDTWEPVPAPEFALRDAAGRTVRLADYRGRNLVLVFYLGNDCSHCLEQLTSLGKELPALTVGNTAVLAITAAPLSGGGKERPKRTRLPFPILSDPDHAVARRYQAYDTFESRELHAVVFIDPDSRVRWYTVGSTPFTDWSFLKGEIERVAALRSRKAADPAGR